MPFKHSWLAHALFSSASLDFSRDLHKIWWTIAVRSISKLLQARFTTQSKRTYKISAFTQQREMVYTDSQVMLVLSFTVASLYYNCSIQMVAPVPDIMDDNVNYVL
jgi:hypothetical protein